jgi:hypothetical protein
LGLIEAKELPMRSSIQVAFCATGVLLAAMTGACSSGSGGAGASSTGGSTSSSTHATGGTGTSSTTSTTSTSTSSTTSSTTTTTTTTTTTAATYAFTTFDGPAGSPTTVNGIDNNGEAVGFTTSTDDAGSVNANFVRKSDGSFLALDLGDPAGSANAINKNGEIVGVANGAAFSMPSATGALTMLSPFSSTSSLALGVSDMGAIVGQYAAADGTHSPGFVDVGGTFSMVVPTSATVQTFVQGINAAGLAVGFYSEDGTTQHGFMLDTVGNHLTILPDPSTSRTANGALVLTQFLGVNAGKKAVGYYQTTDNSQYGFLFDLSTMTYTFLDHPDAAPVNGVQITQITGIDDAGEIAGFFIDASGNTHGFVAGLH